MPFPRRFIVPFAAAGRPRCASTHAKSFDLDLSDLSPTAIRKTIDEVASKKAAMPRQVSGAGTTLWHRGKITKGTFDRHR
jgi:hypothetical protein